MTGFFDTRRPLVFAHRGGCDLGPENTMTAFETGLAAGADGLELDVHLSADGVPVVVHDATLDRTTDASGPVALLTAAQLARVDAGFRFSAQGAYPHRGRGVGVPTLREVLERFEATRIIIELKVDSREMGEAVAAEVRRAGAEGRVCLAGVGCRSLEAARAALPGAASSACQEEVRWALYRSWVGWPVTRVRYGGYQVPEQAGRHRVVTPRFIRHAHRAGLHVQVWTVDAEPDMHRLLSWGADALISNRPDVAVAVRDAVGNSSQAGKHSRID